MRLSLVVAEHDPPRDTNPFAVDAGLRRCQVARFGDRHVAVETRAPRIDSQRLDRLELFQPVLLEAVGSGRTRLRLFRLGHGVGQGHDSIGAVCSSAKRA
jgi:hypothetical protein